MRYSRRGGARLGAGRPKKKDAGVSHRERPTLAENQPVHVTLRVREDVYNLRSQRCFEAIGAAMEASRGRFGFSAVGFSVQGNHIHLMGEAATAEALTLGIQGLKVRIAKGLNRVMGRRGKVFSERYHLRILKTPAEARAAMAYVANNTAKHAAEFGKHLPAGYRDPNTVGHFANRVLLPPGTASMVVEPVSWLLREGWRRRARTNPAAVRCPVPVAVAVAVAPSPEPSLGTVRGLFPDEAPGLSFGGPSAAARAA
jgi:REP element-mobilizing transposase RayT